MVMMVGKQENGNSKSNRSRGGAAPFLTKTHEMVEDAGTDEVIAWEEKGRSFVVWKPVEFARDLLPVHFKHCNFSSFVRQLNTYGFRKVVADRWEFANENFRRGEQRRLCEIHRRKAVQPQNSSVAGKASTGLNTTTPSTSNSGEVRSSSSTCPPPPLAPLSLSVQHLKYLSDENKKLKNDNWALATELAQAKRQYEELNASLSMQGMLVTREEAAEEKAAAETDEEECDEAKSLKLFGVLLKGFEVEEKVTRKKRERLEENTGSGFGGKPMKMGFSPMKGSNKA